MRKGGENFFLGIICVLLTISIIPVFPNETQEQGTPVCGCITTDTTWNESGSPYWVECDIIVEEGVTLSILSGVQVRFNGSYGIYVEGALSVALNATDSPAVFTSNKSNPQTGDWGAIQFNFTSDDDNCTIANSIIEYSEYGIRLEQASPYALSHNVIRYNVYGIYSNHSTPRIENNDIVDNENYGISAISLDPEGRDPPYEPWPAGIPVPIYVGNSNISSNGERGINLQASSINITSSEIGENGHSGIYLSQTNLTVWGSDISGNNRHGLRVEYSSNITISNNTFHENYLDGISLYHSNWNEIEKNNFTANYCNGIHLKYSSNNTIEENEVYLHSRITSPPGGGGWCVGEAAGPGITLYEDSNNNTIIKNNLTHQEGAGVYVENTKGDIIKGNEFYRNDIGVELQHAFEQNVSFNNFSMDGNGIWIAGYSDRIDVYSNHIRQDTYGAGTGIFLNHTSFVRLLYNDLEGSMSQRGIGFGAFSSSLLISKNDISNYSIGIHASITYWVMQGPSIERNNISKCEKGIQVDGGETNLGIAWNYIHENDYGIYVSSAHVPLIDNNTISWNEVSGIYLEYSSFANITHNRVENNTEKGIWIDDSYARIYDYNDIANNDIGIYLEGTADADINYNNIFGNTAFGLKNWGSNTPDATWNWWGDSRGPYDYSDDGCCVQNTNTNGDRVLDDSSHAADYCGSGSDWLTAKT